VERFLPGFTIVFFVAIAMPMIAVADLIEAEIEAPGPQGPLKGLMLSPGAANAPVVLIIPGSGHIDRDGNSLQGIRTDAYKLLAQGLATHGITTVRIDKRGMYSSAVAITNGNDVTIAAYASDVHIWAATINKQTGAKCVWVLGHSEGGLVALAAAADNSTDICGLLLVASMGRRPGDIIRAQLRANPANTPILDEALRDIDALEAGTRVDAGTMNPVLLPLFAPQIQDFLINEYALDPAALIARCRQPVLIVQGERDIQISVADARHLKAACAEATLALLPDVNHVLKSVASDDKIANLRTYSDPKLPLAPGVVEAIADFIAAAPKSP